MKKPKPAQEGSPGWVLQQALIRAGLTQTAAARELGVLPETVSRWVHNKYPYPRMVLLALAQLARQRRTEPCECDPVEEIPHPADMLWRQKSA